MFKHGIEDETQALFFVLKHNYEGFRKDVSWFNGSHTAAVANVMSADDEITIILETVFVFVFCFYKVLQKQKRHCKFAD